MSKKTAKPEADTEDEELSSNALDALMDTAYENLPEIMETIPGGTWRLRARNAAFKDATETQSSKFLFFYVPVEPADDVDPEALAAAGADYDYTNNQIVVSIYVANLRDLKKVMGHIAMHGVDLEGLNPKQAIKKIRGKEIMANVGARSYEGTFGTVHENTASGFSPVNDDDGQTDEA